MNKSAGLRVRIEPELHRDFMQACHSQNLKAADVLREYVKQFVEKNGTGQQASLFGGQINK